MRLHVKLARQIVCNANVYYTYIEVQFSCVSWVTKQPIHGQAKGEQPYNHRK